MKWLAALLFFAAEAAVLGVGIIRASTGKGAAVLWIGIAAMAVVFIKFGCLDNSPKEH